MMVKIANTCELSVSQIGEHNQVVHYYSGNF